MKIGLCMSVIGGSGGNDTVFYSIKHYLENNDHKVTEFSLAKNDNSRMPKFGLFRQLQTINHKDMHKQDLLIFLTGIPPKTKVPIVYYHQQMPPSFAKTYRPLKYNRGLWKIYYAVFRALAKEKIDYFNKFNNYCVSIYLQERLEKSGIKAELVRPAIIQNDLPDFPKNNRAVTICRISPEKNLAFNLKVLSGYRYTIFGTINRFTAYYLREMEKRFEPLHNVDLHSIRNIMLRYLLESKVYFSSSKETLGLAVLEGISAGCIPIVVDNTANRETVPFRELRYQEGDYVQARELVDKAFNGGFDYLLPELKSHIQKFTEDNYKKLFIIESERYKAYQNYNGAEDLIYSDRNKLFGYQSDDTL